MKLAVIDLETTGLDIETDCILEIGLVVLDADKPDLPQIEAERWLVLPPDVDGPKSFAAWEKRFAASNPYVFEMHSQKGENGTSLLDELRALASPEPWVEPLELKQIEDAMVTVLLNLTPNENLPLTQGKSEFLFAGNSIANLDIPMVKKYFPRFHSMLHYRIMDVSVLRTFYTHLAGGLLPEDIAVAIAGGAKGHRAYDDAKHAADTLRELVQWVRTHTEVAGPLPYEEVKQLRAEIARRDAEDAARKGPR
jgi:oligoribonuclease (3'-5' exoribonuclease)